MIRKVISGGQNGVDLTALEVAKELGYQTGGWAPKGYKTTTGPNLDLRDLYGLQEHELDRYPPRTFANVRDSDGTLRIAFHFDTPGELCTLKAIKAYERPYFDVLVGEQDWISLLDKAKEWLDFHDIQILNVAGNANKQIVPIARAFLKEVLYDM